MFSFRCSKCSRKSLSAGTPRCLHCGNVQPETAVGDNLNPIEPGAARQFGTASGSKGDHRLDAICKNFPSTKESHPHKKVMHELSNLRNANRQNSASDISNLQNAEQKNRKRKIPNFEASKGESIPSVADNLAVPGPSGLHQNKNASNLYEEKFQSGTSLELQSAALKQDVHNSGKAENVLKKRKEPYLRCWKCGKWFKNEPALIVHQQNNCEPNPYKCKKCEKKFANKCWFERHLRLHSANKPFQCDQCAFTTKWEGSLKCHKERYHKK